MANVLTLCFWGFIWPLFLVKVNCVKFCSLCATTLSRGHAFHIRINGHG